MAGSGIIYKIARPIADAFVDAVFARLFDPKRIESEPTGAGDDLVAPAAARGILRWLHEQGSTGARPEYTPHDQPVEPPARGYETTRRHGVGSDDGHPAGMDRGVTGSASALGGDG